ncbi:flippase [Pseudomonas sp. p1(2021b)]|uniref:flippase n=1 Tax=Pseudomonas sp. p1(2021b) TaxID=2874628 RepID=UPI001CCA746F|nr:flippase [Pseudomonas sp. p1(2021b)]UBM26565.1 flippase [Pseudomonas sp. p1(2021b)]
MAKKYIIKTLSLLGFSSLAGAGLAFLTQILLARNLGVNEYGAFSSAFGTVALLTPLAGFGIAPMWLKVFGLEGEAGKRWVRPSFIFSICSTALTIFFIVLWAILIDHDALNRVLLLIMSTYIFGQVFLELVSARLQLEERYLNLSIWQFLPHLGRFLLICLVVYTVRESAEAIYVAISYSAVSLLASLFGLRYLRGMATSGVQLVKGQDYYKYIDGVGVTIKDVIKACWPFGVGAFAHLIYYQSDIVMIQYFTGDKAAGEYNIAFIIMTAVYLLPSMVYQKFLMPKIHRWSNYDLEKLYKVYKLGSRYMLILGCISTVVLWLLGEWGIAFLFGEEYKNSSSLLNILALSAPIIFLALSAGSVLVTQEHMLEKVKYMLLVAVINVLLNLLCIPAWGAEGAAVTTVISNLLLLCLYLYGANRSVFIFKN